MRVARDIVLTQDEEAELMRLVRSRLTSVRLEQRAGMVLLAAAGVQNKDLPRCWESGGLRSDVGASAMHCDA